MRGQQEIIFHCHVWADCVGGGFVSSKKKIDRIDTRSSEHKVIAKRLTKKKILFNLPMKHNTTHHVVTLLVTWHPPPKSSPCHQTQFRIPRNSSALCIFRVKLYFRSFMSNLNSWPLHSDLDRILNLSWTPNPFHKTHVRAHASTRTHAQM